MSREGRDEWWRDREEDTGEYDEYFDVESKRWVRVSRNHVGEYMSQPYIELSNHIREYRDSIGSASFEDDGWVTFDSDASEFLRGRGSVRKTSKTFSNTMGLKLYIASSVLMAGVLAAAGRFMELGIVGLSILIVLTVWRWRR